MGLEMFQCEWCGWRMPKSREKVIEAHEATHRPRHAPVDIDRMIDDAARGKATPQATAVDRLAAFARIMTMPPEEAFERLFRKPILEEFDRADIEGTSEVKGE